MNIDVYDTYVHTSEGDLLHFDFLLPSGKGGMATQHAKEWLQSIGGHPEEVSLDKCSYCHTETATLEMVRQIHERGYFIIQIEGCPAGNR